MSTGRTTGSSPSPTPNAVGPRHTLYVGTITLTIQTTNPLQYTLVDEYYIVGGVYSFLMNYGPNWELEPDLALRWAQINSNPSTWEFHLTKNAYWVDPRYCASDSRGHITDCNSDAAGHKFQVNATDVKFTWDYVKRHQDSTTYFKPCTEHVASVDLNPADPFYVKITYDGPYAAALASLTCVPILPKYIWSPGGVDVAVDWSNALPIGSGAYMVRPAGTTFQMVTPPPLFLDRNPLWHGKEVQGRQVFPDTVQFVNYETSGAESVDLTLGKIDLALSPESSDWLGYLYGKPGIIEQSLPDGFEAEQAINVLPDNLRAAFAAKTNRPLERGHTNPVLLNQIVRTAIHMVTNRQKMIGSAWPGLAAPGDTLLPKFHPWHVDIPPYSTDDKNGDGNPNDFPPFIPLNSPASWYESFPDGPDAPNMARSILVHAGWEWVCATGARETGVEFPLCQKDTTSGAMINALNFRFSTFSTPPWWETAARGVIEDARKAGIQFNLELLNGAQMYSLWYQLDYDVWLWDWVWTPITDTSLALVVQTCGGIITLDNDNGFCMVDPATKRWTFDDLYNKTLSETNEVARRAVSDQMMRIIYGFASYNLPFYLSQLYAMNEVRFTNWVDFRQFRAVPPDVGNSPLLGQVVYSIDQKPPQFTLSDFEGVAGRPVQFSVSAIDPEGGPLKYRWDFDANRTSGTEPGGSGVNADGILDNDDQWTELATATTPTHTYATPGTYEVVLRVSEDGGDFFTVHRAKVTIRSVGTGSPKISALAFSPSDPTTLTGDTVTLAASASDPTGLVITQYTWNWNYPAGPTTTTTIPTANHQYSAPGTYTVQLTVQNSASGTSSSSTIVPVIDNVAPAVAGLASKSVVVGSPDTFVAFASDQNSRDLLNYSWNFGDTSCTPQPSCTMAFGNPVNHTYAATGTFTQTVQVSDGRGHTTPASATITSVSDKNTVPGIAGFTASAAIACPPADTCTGVPVAFTASVSDAEGNSLRWQWDFNNDGTTDLEYVTPVTSPGQVQTRTETYTFATAGSFRPKLTITDIPPGTSAPKTNFQQTSVRVALNQAPTLTGISPSPTISGPGLPITFSTTSHDNDGDALSYTWTWDDGQTTTGTTPFFGGTISTTHTYAFEGTYHVILVVDDGKGGQSRQAVDVTVVTQSMSMTVTSNRREMMGGEVATIHVTLVSGSTAVGAATLTPSTPLGGAFSSVRNLGSGNYAFDWTAPSLTRQTFAPVNVLARATGYLDTSGRVTILVDPNKTNPTSPTQLFLLVRAPATSLHVGESMTITVYAYTIEGYVVSGATLTLLRVGPGTVSAVTDQLNGLYTFVYTAPASVSGPTPILITITASKFGYLNATARLAITVVP